MKEKLIWSLVFILLTACTTTVEEKSEILFEEMEQDPEIILEEENLSQEQIENIIEEEEEVQSVEETIEEDTTQEQESFAEGWEEHIDAALAPSYCFATEGKTFSGESYTGPLIDTHYHIADLPDSDPNEEEDDEQPLLGVNIKIADTVCTLQQENTSKVFAFFPGYAEIPEESVEVVERTMKKYPEQFVPFIMPPDDDDEPGGFATVDAATLEDMLEISPDLFEGYGEIGLYEREGGANELPPDSKRLEEIYSVIEEQDLVVYFHLGEGHKNKLEKVAQAHPEINFIFHGDQLSMDDIEDLIENNPNIYYTIDELYGDIFLIRPEISKKQFLAHFDEYESLLRKDWSTWRRVIEKHPNQFMWGTDRSDQVLWSHDPEVGITLANYARAFIAGLDPEVQERFAYKNAEEVLS